MLSRMVWFMIGAGGLLHSASLFAGEVTVDAASVKAFVERCRKSNGAFGPIDQDYTDAAWNYPAIRILQLLGHIVGQDEAIIRHGLTIPTGHVGLGHYHFFHQHGILQALGRPAQPRHRQVSVVEKLSKAKYYNSPFGIDANQLYNAPGGSALDPHDLAAETFFFFHLPSLSYLLAGLESSGRTVADPKPLIEYVRSRQAPNGGFVDLRGPGGSLQNSDATMAHTRHALECLRILNALDQISGKGVEQFVRTCLREFGGYAPRPDQVVTVANADIHDTWAALSCLRILNKPIPSAAVTRDWINSLQNPDGGFGDRRGWRSRLYSTFYAVSALACLSGNGQATEAITPKRLSADPPPPPIDASLRIFQAQFKMPVIAPQELDLIHRRGFHLLALKSDKFEDAEVLQRAIRARALPMEVILCPEAYPHQCVFPGGAVLDHIGNFTLDPRWGFAERQRWLTADGLGRQRPTWADYRDRVLQPLIALGSLTYPEQDYDQETAYEFYGHDLSGKRGYNAVLVGFNWPPQDFVRVFPWRERYVTRLVPIADVDAHGDLAKWNDHLDRVRTLYVAKSPSSAEFLAAAAAGRVVTVIAPGGESRPGPTYYGSPQTVAYLREREATWRWWNAPSK